MVRKLVLLIVILATLIGSMSTASAANGQLMQKPLSGTVTQEFGPSHSGIDVAAASGTPVYATSDGVVMDTRIGSYRYDTGALGAGNYIVLRHCPGDLNQSKKYCPKEDWTKYMHLKDVYVKIGQNVKRGQLIGSIGNTGNTTGITGNHLHFEIHENGRYGPAVNPRDYIRFG